MNALNQESALSCIYVFRGIILATVSANFRIVVGTVRIVLHVWLYT